jgi:predicted nucleotidyltransferase
MSLRLDLDRGVIAAFCRRHHIRRLAVFGSALRDDFRPDSDVDLLAEFQPEHTPGLIGLGAMEEELGRVLGRRAELVTAKGLSRHIRDDVLAAAEPVYADG